MTYANAVKVAEIVRDAGGHIVGRTRLQKLAYLLNVAGLEDGFSFTYKHYGPYSEDLASAARDADLLGLLTETEQQASWGGTYSTYSVAEQPNSSASSARRRLAAAAAAADAIDLELAATALFLAKEGHPDPWAETARRKPEKAKDDRIEKAKALYRAFASIQAPVPWPMIA
jgi:uncharacterized protein YwgA